MSTVKQVWYQKQLYRSSKDKMVSGLIGGIGNFLGVNSTLLRLGYSAITAFTGFFPGIFAYVVGSIIVPNESKAS